MGAGVVTERATAAMRSPINWALLGLVIQRPSYGYEFLQRFERTYGDAIALSSVSQVYTALDTLTRRGFVEEIEAERISPATRQPKPHYRATVEGVHHYQQWLIAHIQDERRRSRLFARQLAMLAPAYALAVIERCERACLEDATATGRRPVSMDGEGVGDLAASLVGEEERLAAGARLAWIDYARRQLKAHTTTPHPLR
jgi:DNA-binding PadR family transcriptional regulator